MAGPFGFEADKFEVSKTIANATACCPPSNPPANHDHRRRRLQLPRADRRHSYLRARTREAAENVSAIVDRGKEQISAFVDKSKEQVGEYTDRGRAQWEEFVERGKNLVADQTTRVAAAVDAGRPPTSRRAASPKPTSIEIRRVSPGPCRPHISLFRRRVRV
jgi:hypothetical protein